VGAVERSGLHTASWLLFTSALSQKAIPPSGDFMVSAKGRFGCWHKKTSSRNCKSSKAGFQTFWSGSKTFKIRFVGTKFQLEMKKLWCMSLIGSDKGSCIETFANHVDLHFQDLIYWSSPWTFCESWVHSLQLAPSSIRVALLWTYFLCWRTWTFCTSDFTCLHQFQCFTLPRNATWYCSADICTTLRSALLSVSFFPNSVS
jgi:hypothetical protein